MRREFDAWLIRQPNELLAEIDHWLAGLSDADLDTVCCGEESEIAALMESAPPFTDDLLNDYFDKVC
ncbi:hypothetical protein [Methylocystis sp. S23]